MYWGLRIFFLLKPGRFAALKSANKNFIFAACTSRHFISRSTFPISLLNTSAGKRMNFLWLAMATNVNLNGFAKRHFSKKKKGSIRIIEEEEESDDEDEDYETIEPDEMIDGYNLVKKSVPSMRVDTILKAGLTSTKRKMEKEFYAMKIRKNGENILKKSTAVFSGDEIDLIKGISPDNSRFLVVDRVIVHSIGKVSGTGNYPLKLQVFKSLTIENYDDPWSPSTAE